MVFCIGSKRIAGGLIEVVVTAKTNAFFDAICPAPMIISAFGFDEADPDPAFDDVVVSSGPNRRPVGPGIARPFVGWCPRLSAFN
jgi:hypothetical protein